MTRTGRPHVAEIAELVRSARVRLSLRTRARRVPAALFGSIAARVIVLISPVVFVRIGWLRCNRIGHYVLEPEQYLSDVEVFAPPVRGKWQVDVWYEDHLPTCNAVLQRMWRRRLRILPKAIFRPAREGLIRHRRPEHVIASEDRVSDLLDTLIRTSPHLSFVPSEVAEAEAQLRGLGIPSGAEWVCIHNRDSAYLDATQPHTDWSYHDYRDSDIAKCVAAAEALADRGYWVVRVGAIVDKPMESNHPMVIDYAWGALRSPLLDIYLAARCRFFISTGAGILGVAMAFRRPQLLVNHVPLSDAPIWYPSSLAMFKHHVDAKTGRTLGPHEVLSRGLVRACETTLFDEAGVRLVENSPEEIKAAALELDDLLCADLPVDTAAPAASLAFWESIRSEMIPFVKGEPRLRLAGRYLASLREGACVESCPSQPVRETRASS